jgi:hypothetical protein
MPASVPLASVLDSLSDVTSLIVVGAAFAAIFLLLEAFDRV